MKNGLENVVIECLCDSLRVLLCAEAPGIICSVTSLVGRNPLFNFLKATSADAATLYIQQLLQWQCIIIDSKCSFMKEVLCIINQQSLWIPVIVLADKVVTEPVQPIGNDKDMVMYAHLYRTKRKMQKVYNSIQICSRSSLKELMPLLQDVSVRKKLMKKKPQGFAEKAFDTLCAQNPISVDQWALYLESTSRKIHRAVNSFSDYIPRHMVALYHAYRIAFQSITDESHKESNKGETVPYRLDEHERKRIMEYFLLNRSILVGTNKKKNVKK